MSTTSYPTRRLGTAGPVVSSIGYGAMSVAGLYGPAEEAAALETLTRAADLGVTFWDTADVYGSEPLLGKWFASTGRRSEIFLATKWGYRDLTPGVTEHRFNSKPSYIRRQLESSLAALKTDHIDLYYQHRVDPEVPIEVVMETLRPYVEKGTIRHIGLSDCHIDVLKRAKAVPGVGEKLVAAQMEFSPFELGVETSGFAAAAEKLGVAVIAYSPLGRGMISGKFKSRADFAAKDLRLMMPRFSEENFPVNLTLVSQFEAVAKKHSATPSQIALAWILARSPNMIPIPGSKDVGRLEENAGAARIQLSVEDVKALDDAVAAADIRGDRRPQMAAHVAGNNCIPLEAWKGE
ncbi:hypothetical protein EIP91_007206 [Steccherinum ochraceum]|uniref:NADP-dependent oxidoreductase domain-containing protein n=1 Tax=Steccherinum ochraceum TaxID=92696 RepID=A0A4V2MVE8_9APHY|nr:hypothetical protein EIP91_007206 [Steccherinum ochraceum]